jgi:hypothetical protein
VLFERRLSFQIAEAVEFTPMTFQLIRGNVDVGVGIIETWLELFLLDQISKFGNPSWILFTPLLAASPPVWFSRSTSKCTISLVAHCH